MGGPMSLRLITPAPSVARHNPEASAPQKNAAQASASSSKEVIDWLIAFVSSSNADIVEKVVLGGSSRAGASRPSSIYSTRARHGDAVVEGP